jgi:hypothetical protein
MGYTVAIDPGDTVGICIFDENGGVQVLDQLPFEAPDGKDFLHWLEEFNHPVDTVVFETWITYRQKAAKQVGSKQKAAQGIGAIKSFAIRKKAKLVEQKADIMPIAMQWSGLKMPSQHSKTHKYAAYLHGYFYLQKEGIIKPRVPLIGDM